MNYDIDQPAKESRFRHKFWILLVMLGLSIVASGLAYFYRKDIAETKARDQRNAELIRQAQPVPPPEPEPISASGKYLFSGTVVLARGVEQDALEKSPNDRYGYTFSKFDSFEPEQYDAWLADLECPVTDAQLGYYYQIENLVFNCSPEYIQAMQQYINIVNLANNHTSDQGADGFAETKRRLNELGVQHVGSYDPSVPEDACEVIALPIRLNESTEADGYLPVAFCAWHYFFSMPDPGQVSVMQEYAATMPTFGFMHAGAEYVATASQHQRNVAHTIIDNGAEFVIGNSPHWVQNTESYKGKPIFYSTGNFIFDQLDAETNRGANIEVSLSVPDQEGLEEWLALGESCKQAEDDCLSQAVEQGLPKLDVTLEYDVVASIGGFRELTEKAPPEVQAAVEQRMQLNALLKAIGQTSSN